MLGPTLYAKMIPLGMEGGCHSSVRVVLAVLETVRATGADAAATWKGLGITLET